MFLCCLFFIGSLTFDVRCATNLLNSNAPSLSTSQDSVQGGFAEGKEPAKGSSVGLE